MIDERTIELIHAALDGELDRAGSAELEEHLARSAEARQYHDRMQELSVFLDRAPEQEVPPGLRDKVLAGIELPSFSTERGGFGFLQVPGFARYGLAAAAGLLLAIGIYEFRPGAGTEPDLTGMVGTILPGDKVLDSYSFSEDGLNTSVKLKRRDEGLVLDVHMDSPAPFEITVDFTGEGLQFDAIAQLESDLSSIEIADQAIQVKGRGRQHFAVLLHREDDLADSAAATIRLDYSSEGKLLNSGELKTK